MCLQVSIISSPDYFDQHGQEWLEFSRVAETYSPFMHPLYQKAWWQYEGQGELQIIEARDENRLIGLFPLHSFTHEGKVILRFVGAVEVSDYLDVLIDPSYATGVYQAFIEQLQHMTWDEVRLEGLHHQSPTLTEFADKVREHWQVEQKQQDVCPVIALPETFDAYLESLDGSQRKHFRRLRRSIGAEDEIEYQCFTKREEIESRLPTFIELHKASSTDKNQFWTADREVFFIEAMTALAEAGLVKLFFLTVNTDPAATLILFDFKSEWLGYNSGFNAYQYGHMGVSNAIFLYAIEEAIKAKKSNFDFMRGSEPYKFQFGAKAQPLYKLIISRE